MPRAARQPVATLIAHRGATVIPRNRLADIEAPEPTDTWKPIKHNDLFDTLEECLNDKEIEVSSQEIAVQKEGNVMFGVMNLNREYDGFCAALGIRAANDKSMAIRIAVGIRVFVCDNLSFSGDLIALNRKHTKNLDIKEEIVNAIIKYEHHLGTYVANVDKMKGVDISDVQAKSLIHDIYFDGIMPVKTMKKVSSLYFDPQHDDFKERNLWSLNNAFTSIIKPMSAPRKFKALHEIGVEFNRILAA